MWLTFFAASLLTAAIFVIPGFCISRMVGYSFGSSIARSPARSIAFLTALGLVTPFLGGNTSLLLYGIAIALLAIFALALSKRRCSEANNPEIGTEEVAWFIVWGVCAAVILFVIPLDGPSSFQPDNDNASHLNLIYTMARSGNYSTLSTSDYLLGGASPLVSANGYYPASFHIVGALVLTSIGAPVALVENAIVFILAGVVFPLGQLCFAKVIAKDSKCLLYSFPMVSMACLGFPWRLTTWGPLFPNMLSYALTPIAFAAFASALDGLINHRAFVKETLASFVAILAVGMSHPNGIFLLYIFISVYLVAYLFQALRERVGLAIFKSGALALVLAAVFALVWLLLFKMPAFQGVVNFVWGSTCSPKQALLYLLTSSYAYQGAQPVLAFLCLYGIGCIVVGRKSNWCWLVVVFAFVSTQYVICASCDSATSLLKRLFCGFWYSDVNRICANVALAEIPLAAIGTSALFERLYALFGFESQRENAAVARPRVLVCSIPPAILVAIVALGVSHVGTLGFDRHYFLQPIKYSVSAEKPYDYKESAFVEKVRSIVGDDLVLNMPNDGSCFAYTLNNLNVFYRTVGLAGGHSSNETGESRLIRTSLVDYETNKSVREAVESTSARYVLQLDYGKSTDWVNDFLPPYFPEVWEGISSINEDTPGFKLLLSDDDMRLYEIEY